MYYNIKPISHTSALSIKKRKFLETTLYVYTPPLPPAAECIQPHRATSKGFNTFKQAFFPLSLSSFVNRTDNEDNFLGYKIKLGSLFILQGDL